MAILNPPRPGYLRSSENTRGVEAQAAAEMRRLAKVDSEAQKREDELEALACGVSCSSCSDLTDKSERLVDVMLAEDYGVFDVEGVVR